MSGEGFATTSSAARPAPVAPWLRSGAIVALGLLSLGLYVLSFRPMTHQLSALETDLERTHQQIIETGFGYPEAAGSYLTDAEAKLANMHQLAEALSARFAFYPEMTELLTSKFRVLEYEQRRFDIRERLTQLAEAQDSSLPADLFGGLPSYYRTTERQQELWIHLEFFNHVLEALLTSGPGLQIEQIESLRSGQAEAAATGPEGRPVKIQLRLKLRAPAASLVAFLNQTLPGGSQAKAYSIDALDLQRAAADGHLSFDVLLSGFNFSHPVF